MSKFRNKYRVESARAQWWDYGKKAAYFITICTKGGEPYFGTVENEQMRLFPAGVLADVLWCEIPHHFPHVFLGNHVVMPNHMHGILVLESLDKSKNMGHPKDNLKKDNPVETGHVSMPPSAVPCLNRKQRKTQIILTIQVKIRGIIDFKILGKIRFHPL